VPAQPVFTARFMNAVIWMAKHWPELSGDKHRAAEKTSKYILDEFGVTVNEGTLKNNLRNAKATLGPNIRMERRILQDENGTHERGLPLSPLYVEQLDNKAAEIERQYRQRLPGTIEYAQANNLPMV
jgi:hypothetical protein